MNPIVSSKRKTVVKLEVTNVTPVLVGLEFTTHYGISAPPGDVQSNTHAPDANSLIGLGYVTSPEDPGSTKAPRDVGSSSFHHSACECADNYHTQQLSIRFFQHNPKRE